MFILEQQIRLEPKEEQTILPKSVAVEYSTILLTSH